MHVSTYLGNTIRLPLCHKLPPHGRLSNHLNHPPTSTMPRSSAFKFLLSLSKLDVQMLPLAPKMVINVYISWPFPITNPSSMITCTALTLTRYIFMYLRTLWYLPRYVDLRTGMRPHTREMWQSTLGGTTSESAVSIRLCSS